METQPNPPYDLSAEHHPNVVANYGRSPVRFVRGEGVWLYDEQGRGFLDGLAGIAVNALGHSHPALTAAIREQAGQLVHTSNLFHIGPQEELAHALCDHSFGDRIFFCNSGAEANEVLYKLARLYGNVQHEGKKPRIVSSLSGFHGRTLGALALTGTAAYRTGFEPLPPVDYVPFGDIAALQEALRDDVAALFLEPMQGEGGVVVPPEDYLHEARALCDQYGILLMIDEVQTGVGRTGDLFGYQASGIRPDAMSLAKGLGGGVPIGAAVVTEAVAALLKPGTHGSTFGGNYLASAAALAVFKTVNQPAFLANVKRRSEQLHEGLATIFPDHEIRGRGLLVGVVQPEAPAPLVAECLKQGLVVGSAGGNVLRLAPPLTITADEVEVILERLQASVNAITVAK